MATLLYKNGASTTLSGNITNAQTSITVTAATAFPVITGSDYFYITVYELSGATEINIEIMKVTATVGTTFTVVRAQEGTTGTARTAVTAYVENRFTAASAALALQATNNLSDLTSQATAQTNLGLGTMSTQAASAVNITGGTIAGAGVAAVATTFTIQDNTDATKKISFVASGITTGTTRAYTMPNSSGTVALLTDLSTGYQPLAANLTGMAALAANGITVRTGAGTYSSRSLTAPAAGITITNPDGVAGNPTFALANALSSIQALATTGLGVRSAADTWITRSMAAPAAGLTITNPDGVAGNPTFALANDLGAIEALNTNGILKRTATDTWAVAVSGTDYAPATSGTGILKGDGLGGHSTAVSGTDYQLPIGTISGLAKGNGANALTAAVAGTDYLAPASSYFLGTTTITFNRASGAQSLTGISIDGSAGSATSATTATNIASGVLGSIPYQSGVGTTSLLGPNTSAVKQFFSMTGTGTVGAAPAWGALTAGDIPALSYQAVLVSATNIKTINGNSLLGSGDLAIAGAVDLSSAQTLSNKTFTSYSETVVNITATTATQNIDMAAGNVFNITLNFAGTTAFSFINPPASGVLRSATVILTQGSGGSHLATFANAVYTDSVTPTLTTTAGKRDILSFFTIDAGTTFFGQFAYANL